MIRGSAAAAGVALRAAALAAMALPVAARAQAIDLSSGGPVEVTARVGFEWHENDQEVIATGDARAVRGDVTVIADRLLARYRKKGTGPGGGAGLAVPAPAALQPGRQPNAGDPDSGGNEVYRLEAEGHVRILTPTDEAIGDKAIYDIDQALLVMTGNNLKLTTPQQVITARDSLEYWSQQHMAIGRGNAVVVTHDGRRVSGDVLVAFTADPNEAPPPGARTVATRPADKPGTDSLTSSGKLKRVEAYGNVEVRTATDTVRGDRGVYVPDTGIARVFGHVRVTHGENQLNGPAADVNMKTGIAHIISNPNQRVEGLLVPNAAQPGPTPLDPKAAKPPAAKPPADRTPPP